MCGVWWVVCGVWWVVGGGWWSDGQGGGVVGQSVPRWDDKSRKQPRKKPSPIKAKSRLRSRLTGPTYYYGARCQPLPANSDRGEGQIGARSGPDRGQIEALAGSSSATAVGPAAASLSYGSERCAEKQLPPRSRSQPTRRRSGTAGHRVRQSYTTPVLRFPVGVSEVPLT